MKLRRFLALSLLIVTALSLPAPVTEDTTPAPTQTPKPKPKPRPKATETAATPKKIQSSPFGGAWSGSSIGVYQCADGSTGATKDSGKPNVIQITADGKNANGHPTYLGTDGRTLVWRFIQTITTENGVSHASGTCTFALTSSNTAVKSEEQVVTDGPLLGCNYKWNGNYTRR